MGGLQQAGTDAKLSRLAIHYEYLFAWGINFKDREIELCGDIDEGRWGVINAALTEMEQESKKTITIKINSLGGSVYDAHAIAARMRECTARIVTKGYGTIQSAATLILACGKKRLVDVDATFMHHECSYGIPEGTRHSQVKNYVAQVDVEELRWAKAMAKCTKKSVKFWQESGTLIDAHFDAKQLLKMGVVDEIF